MLDKQRLLLLESVDLPPHQAMLVLEQRDALVKGGLEVEPFRGATVALHRYPAQLCTPGRNCRAATSSSTTC